MIWSLGKRIGKRKGRAVMRKLVSKICMIWLFIILGIGHSFFVNAEEQGTGVVSGVVSGIQEEDMNFARVVLYNSTNSYQVGISQGGLMK